MDGWEERDEEYEREGEGMGGWVSAGMRSMSSCR